MEPQPSFNDTSYPQTYVVTPPVKAMRVPVQADPGSGYIVIAHLKANTAVEVLSRAGDWLHIALPDGQNGYILFSQARPATADEKLSMQQSSAIPNRQRERTGNGSILQTQQGLSRVPRFSISPTVPATLLSLGVGSCLCGAILGRSLGGQCDNQNQNCTVTNGVFVGIGGFLVLAAVIFFVLGILIGATLFFRSLMNRS